MTRTNTSWFYDSFVGSSWLMEFLFWIRFVMNYSAYVPLSLFRRDCLSQNKQESLALASMARDDSPASSTASSTAPASSTAAQCAVKWDRNLKPKLAIMRQCTSVTDRRTDGLASWHKHEMYILHLALIINNSSVHDNSFQCSSR